MAQEVSPREGSQAQEMLTTGLPQPKFIYFFFFLFAWGLA